MSSLTCTSVDTGVHLILKLSPSFDPQQSLDRLTEILLRYELWDDQLSVSLFRWGVEVLSLDVSHEAMAQPAFLKQAQAHIDMLREKILVNPLDSAPLQQPVLERAWVWEQWQLRDYKALYTKSPWDGQPMLEERTHSFAQEMLAWSSSLPHTAQRSLQVDQTQLDRSLMQSCQTSSDLALKMFTYCQLARNASLTRAVREELRHPMEKASKAYEAVWKQTRELVQRETELAQQRAEAHEQKLNQRIERIDQTHQQTTDLLKDKIEQGKQQLHQTQHQLHNAQSQCQQLEQDVHHLRACYAQKVQEVQSLRNSSSGGGGGCVIL